MTERTKRILIGVGLAVVVLGLLGWYMASHPAPVKAPTVEVPTEPKKITEEATYYTADATYPSETALKARAGASADQSAITLMKTYIEQRIADFKKNGNFENLSHDDVQMLQLDQRKYAIDIEYKTFSSPRTVSYVYQIFEDTGGAHPNTYFHTFTFDLQSGSELKTADLFESGEYLTTLSTLSRAKLPALIAERENVSVNEVAMDFITDGTKPEAASFANFYLDGSSLILVFPPYQVGPYVLGRVDLAFKTSEVAGLKSQYTQ